jgi:hypothetical protein
MISHTEAASMANPLSPAARDEAIDLVLIEMGYRPLMVRLIASVARDDRETRHTFETLDLAGRIVDSLLVLARQGQAHTQEHRL